MPKRLTDKEMYHRGTPESVVLRCCLEYLSMRGVYAWRNNVGATKTEHGAFVRFGKVGAADILGIAPGGKLLCVETKTETGQLSTAQEAFRDAVTAHGAIYVVARPSSYQQVLDEALGVQE